MILTNFGQDAIIKTRIKMKWNSVNSLLMFVKVTKIKISQMSL